MTEFRGFETEKDARAFCRQHGGYITWEERTPKRRQLTERGRQYRMAVDFGGLNAEKYPYCVQWTAKGA